MNIRLVAVLSSSLAVLSPALALASEPVDEAPAEVARTEAPTYKSYKTEVIIADVASLGLGLTTAVLSDGDSDTLRLAAAFTALYFVATPVIHVVHGRPMAAAASFAMRTVGVPAATLAGGGLGYALCGGEGWDCLLTLGLFGGLGLIGGVAAATAIDAEYLAKEEVRRPASTSVRVLPSVDPITRSVSLGAGVTF